MTEDSHAISNVRTYILMATEVTLLLTGFLILVMPLVWIVRWFRKSPVMLEEEDE